MRFNKFVAKHLMPDDPKDYFTFLEEKDIYQLTQEQKEKYDKIYTSLSKEDRKILDDRTIAAFEEGMKTGFNEAICGVAYYNISLDKK